MQHPLFEKRDIFDSTRPAKRAAWGPMLPILAILFLCFGPTMTTGFSQSDSTHFEFTMTMSANDYAYIKTKIKEDVIGWCNQRDDKLNELTMKMMIVQDTVIPITVKTDSGTYEIDVVSEFKRRMIGGFAGSYPSVQSWSFDIPEEQLIEIIKEIKIENPNLQVPRDTTLTSGRQSYWHFINFYDKDKNEIISTWTRESTKSSSTLALVGYRRHVEDAYELVFEKLINRDFWKGENDKRIKRFETMIVDRIKEKMK